MLELVITSLQLSVFTIPHIPCLLSIKSKCDCSAPPLEISYIAIALNYTQLQLAIVTLFCRFVNKSSVHTQLSTRQLNARHIGDPKLRTQPFYNLNMTAKVNLAKLRLQTFSSNTPQSRSLIQECRYYVGETRSS